MSGYSSKFDEWARRPDTKAKLDSAKKNAWAQFTKKFPNADKDKFYVQTSVDEKFKISTEVFFNESTSSSVGVFGSDRKYWSQQMKNALGLEGIEGFPFQLSPLETKTALPIPAVEFTESVPSIAKIFNQENRIYAMPDEFFFTNFRNIFQQARLMHKASPNSHPSNPIHKAARASRPDLKKNDKQVSEKPPIDKHEINKTAVIIGVVGVVALLFMASR